MTTIERNYTKNPHTARFLQTFHSGIGTNGRNYRAEIAQADDNAAEYALAAAESADLLDLVSEAPADLRSPRQAELMTGLIAQITELDAKLGAATAKWTADATEAGHWTPGREGNASEWITKMIAKVRELKAAAKTTTPPAAEVADGRYAVVEGGTLKFFRVKNGNRPGFVFLDVQASDDMHPVRNVTRIREVLALIAQDPKGAMVRYGQEIGACGRCGRTLTSEYRNLGLGPICIDK